jgi:hypothetical protein
MKAMKYRTLAQKWRGKRKTTGRRPVRYISKSRNMRESYLNMRGNQEIKKIRQSG